MEATFQVSIYSARAKGPIVFDTVAQAVRAAVQRQKVGVIVDTFIDAERDDYEDKTRLYRKTFDVRAWYRET